MHEMSMATSLIAILRQEMERHNASRLLCVRVKHGALAGIVPEALAMAFEVMTVDTDLAKTRLELSEEPLRLACGGCGREFAPGAVPTALYAPCPACAEEVGHKVLAGKELYIESMEVE